MTIAENYWFTDEIKDDSKIMSPPAALSHLKQVSNYFIIRVQNYLFFKMDNSIFQECYQCIWNE